MALATTVDGYGLVVDGSREGSGQYSFTSTSVDDPDIFFDPKPTTYEITVFYTETRITRKWFALTLSAIETYIAGNPDKNVSWTCTNEKLQSYDMTVSEMERIVTGAQIVRVPEPEEE